MNIENLELETYGQHEELTDRLSILLNGYKDGLTIFKEIIQNADDAKATQVKFLYDKRQNLEWRNPTKLIDSNYAGAQGQALFVYNDSVFTDQDFTNLCRLGASTKKELKDKIGKFGLGFNSVYNLTDCPSILSRNKLVILDPNIKYLAHRIKSASNPGISLPLDKYKADYIRNYSDQFNPYQNIFDCDFYSNNSFSYNSTLMRLPLRQEPSKISNLIYNNESKMKELFEILYNNSSDLLLFTQNVRKIEFHVLEDNNNAVQPKLLFEFEKSPVNYLLKHNRLLNVNKSANDEFQIQSSILSASINSADSNKPTKIETAIILKNSLRISQQNFGSFFSKTVQNTNENEGYWLVVSSFNPEYLIKNDADFLKFIPCVGMAVKLQQSESFSSQFNMDLNTKGSAFCFLPLSIGSTGLNYHVNALFLLSEDRTRFYEKSQGDKLNDNRFKWNDLLIKPLIDNLLLTIQLTINNIKIEGNLSQIVEYFWPIDNKLNLFLQFENDFYVHLMKNDDTPSFARFIPILKNTLTNNQLENFVTLKESLFIDFDLKNDSLNQIAFKTLDELIKQTSLKLVRIDPKYLDKIRENNSIKIVDIQTFLKDYLLIHFEKIDLNDYIQLLTFFINDLNENNEFVFESIKQIPCIPTKNSGFDFLHNLLDPNKNEFYLKLFDRNYFPNEVLSSNEKLMLNLAKHADLLNLKTLKSQMIIDLVHKAESQKSREFSHNLLLFLCQLLNEKKTLAESILNELNRVKWLFAKEKPSDWYLDWYTTSEQMFKSSDLFSDKNELYLGCVRPLFDTSQILNNNSGLLEALNILKNDEDIILSTIEQIKHLGVCLKSNTQNSSHLMSQISRFFSEFYIYLQEFTQNIKDKSIIEERLDFLRSKLSPMNWIYDPESSSLLLGINSFAFHVQYQIEPFLLKLPSLYSTDYKSKHFFECMGVKEHFSLQFLHKKLVELKTKFNCNKLDDLSLRACKTISEEMIYIDTYKKDSSISLAELIIQNHDEFYLPDENCVLRSLKTLCYEKSVSGFLDNSNLLAENQIYMVHSCIASRSFGIKGVKKRVFDMLGVPFGQKEKLVDRIKSITDAYSSKTSLFKGKFHVVLSSDPFLSENY